MESTLARFIEEYIKAANLERIMRGDKPLSWGSFAAESGLKQATAYRIRDFKDYRPGYDVLEVIARYTGEDIHALFDRVRGVEPVASEFDEALALSADIAQLSDANNTQVDAIITELTGRSGEISPKDVALVLLDLRQTIHQLADEIALLRAELHK